MQAATCTYQARHILQYNGADDQAGKAKHVPIGVQSDPMMIMMGFDLRRDMRSQMNSNMKLYAWCTWWKWSPLGMT